MLPLQIMCQQQNQGRLREMTCCVNGLVDLGVALPG